MKKIILSLLVVFLFSGCDVIGDVEYTLSKEYMELHLPGFSLVENIPYKSTHYYGIGAYLGRIIEYTSELLEEVQSPRTTLRRGKGDCEDYAILYMNIYYNNTGKQCTFLGVSSKGERSLSGAYIVDHAVVALPDGTQVCPQTGAKRNYPIVYKIKFDEIFY